MAGPLVLEKGSPPDGARDVPPGLGVPGAAPGRPIALPAPASSSGVERLAAPPPNLPSSSTQVANLAGFGSGKPERSACVSRRRVGWAPSFGSPLQIAAVGCPPEPAAGFMHLQLGYEGPNAVLSSECF